MAMTPCYYLANILDSKFRGQHLKEEEMDKGMSYVVEYHSGDIIEILKFKAQMVPLRDYILFQFCFK